MPGETVLFTLHTEVTPSSLILGLIVAGFLIFCAHMLIKRVVRDAEDRGYEQGFDAYMGFATDDLVDEIYEDLDDMLNPPFGTYPEDC